MSTQNQLHAVFLLAQMPGGRDITYAAVNRSVGFPLGLPGGKVDPGETPEAALRRECAEEGWEITSPVTHIVTGEVENNLVAWFRGQATRSPASPGDNSSPTTATMGELLDSPYNKPLEAALEQELRDLLDF